MPTTVDGALALTRRRPVRTDDLCLAAGSSSLLQLVSHTCILDQRLGRQADLGVARNMASIMNFRVLEAEAPKLRYAGERMMLL